MIRTQQPCFLCDGIQFDEIFPEEVLVECVHKLIDLFAPNLILGISDEISSTGDIERIRLVGRIVNVCADESVLGENGKVDVAKLQPITYDPMNHHYLVLGEKVGQAFHDGAALK